MESLNVVLMTTEEIAPVLRRSPQSIRNSRSKGSTDIPPHLRVGGRILYNAATVSKWLASREGHGDKKTATKARKR